VGDGTGCTSPTAAVVGPNPCAIDARATLGYRAVSAGGRADELVAFVLERHPQRIANRRLIVDDENA
jgi:hypothetical protein